MMKRVAVACLAANLLVATPLAARDNGPLSVKNAEAARGTSRVAVGAFNVGFIFESVDQTKASGGLIGAFGGATKAKSMLVGVSPAMMQQIANEAYADFKRTMAARGIMVMPANSFTTHASFAKAKPSASPINVGVTLEKGSKGQATYYKPAELPVQMMIAGDFQGSGLSSMGLAMASGHNAFAMGEYAKATGIPVINVTYLIDFSQQKRPGAFSFAGIQVNSGISVAADYSKLTLIAPTGKHAVLTVNQPVAVEGDFIDKVDKTGGTNKALQTAANVAGGVAAAFGVGGLAFGKSRTFAFTAKPGNYEQGAVKAVSLANERLVGQLAAYK